MAAFICDRTNFAPITSTMEVSWWLLVDGSKTDS